MDDLATPNKDACHFTGKFTSDESIPLDRFDQRFLSQLVHITVQLLCRGEEMIRNMVVAVTFHVFELDTDG